jgi:hypothetical protein
MLERSRTSPLEIQMFPTTSEATCTAILSHIGRIKLLNIEQSQPALEHFQRTLLALPQEAPLLQTLEITPVCSRDVFRLFTSIFYHFPSLEVLCLISINFDWMIFPLRSLTSLSLACLKLSKNPSWTQFYGVLRQMPSLKNLDSSFDDLQLISPPRHAIEPLQLSLLQTLVINGPTPASVMCSFLSNTTFPQHRNTYLACSFSEGSDLDEYSTTIGVVLPLIIQGNFGCLDRLMISEDAFTLSTKSGPIDNWEAKHAIQFTASDGRHPSASEAARELMAGLATLPTNLIQKIIHVDVSTALTSEQLLGLFGHFTTARINYCERHWLPANN